MLRGDGLSPCEVIVGADRSPKLHIADEGELRAYIRFLDEWAAGTESDPAVILVRVIAPTRYFESDMLESAKERFELLLDEYQDEIAARADAAYIIDA